MTDSEDPDTSFIFHSTFHLPSVATVGSSTVTGECRGWWEEEGGFKSPGDFVLVVMRVGFGG